MTPRDAHLAHTLPLARVLWSAQRQADWLPRVRARHDDVLLLARVIHRGWVRLARDNRGAVGFIARDRGLIHALYVHPRARGRGLASALLEEAKSAAPHLELFTPLANTPARAFYRSHGFIEGAQSAGLHNDEGLADVHCRWQREDMV